MAQAAVVPDVSQNPTICHGFLLSLHPKCVFNLWPFELTIRPRTAARSYIENR